MNEDDVWEALRDLLTASELGEHVYDYGKVPGENGVTGQQPATFAVLSVERRYVEPRQSGGTSVTGWRASVRYVSTTATNARRVGGWVRGAFETSPGRGRRVVVAGVNSTALTHEVTAAVAPDEGRFSGLQQYTFAL